MIKNFLRDESGASAAEYALILALVGAGIAIGAAALGTQVDAALKGATAELEEANAGWGGDGGDAPADPVV